MIYYKKVTRKMNEYIEDKSGIKDKQRFKKCQLLRSCTKKNDLLNSQMSFLVSKKS